MIVVSWKIICSILNITDLKFWSSIPYLLNQNCTGRRGKLELLLNLNFMTALNLNRIINSSYILLWNSETVTSPGSYWTKLLGICMGFKTILNKNLCSRSSFIWLKQVHPDIMFRAFFFKTIQMMSVNISEMSNR